jgi:hypothetical protein
MVFFLLPLFLLLIFLFSNASVKEIYEIIDHVVTFLFCLLIFFLNTNLKQPDAGGSCL